MAKGVNSTIIVGECNGASVVAVVRRRVLAIAATLRSTEHGERHAIVYRKVDGERRSKNMGMSGLVNKQFMRGRQLLSTMIGIHLVLGIFALAIYQDYILPGLFEFAYQAATRFDNMDKSVLEQARAMLGNNNYQQTVLAQQGRELAFHIFWCIMLYLGFNWTRILMGLSWLLGSIAVIPLSIAMTLLDLYHPVMIIFIGFGFIYGIGGALLLFSPSINTYMRTMRR